MADLLSPGAKGEVVLAAGQKVRVSTGGVATVKSDYGAPAGTTTLTANTQDFGPYGVPAKLTVTHTSGATTSYTQISDDPAALTAAQVAALGAVGLTWLGETSLQSHIADAAAKSAPAIVGVNTLLAATLSLPAGASISCAPGVVISAPPGMTVLRAAGDGVTVTDAATSGGLYAFDANGFGGHAVKGCAISGTSSHSVFINGDDCDVSGNEISEAGQSGIVLSGSSGSRVIGNGVEQSENFGIWVTAASSGNTITGNHCEAGGLELVGITYDCHDNKVLNNIARGTGDNGISVTGYRNEVIGNECSGNANHGIGIYGERNTVVGNHGRNNGQVSLTSGGEYAGVTCTPAFGGLARKNVIVGNHFDDNQTRPSQHATVKMATDAYVAWASGAAVSNSNLYRKNGDAIYRATAPGTTGATAPTHTSGSVSDGGVTWLWIASKVNTLARSYPLWVAGASITQANRFCYYQTRVYKTAADGTTGATPPTHTTGNVSDGGVTWTLAEEFPSNFDAYDNTIYACQGTGNVLVDPIYDLTTNKQGYITTGRIKIGAPGRNQALDVLCGTGTPEGVADARPGSIFGRQDVSAPGIALWGKQSGTANTGWLRFMMQDSGTSAARPSLATYGTGARAYSYFDTTLGKPIYWSGSAWVDATGTTA